MGEDRKMPLELTVKRNFVTLRIYIQFPSYQETALLKLPEVTYYYFHLVQFFDSIMYLYVS